MSNLNIGPLSQSECSLLSSSNQRRGGRRQTFYPRIYTRGPSKHSFQRGKFITSKSTETIQVHSSKAYTFKRRQLWVFGALITASFSKNTIAAKYDKEGRNMRKGVLKNPKPSYKYQYKANRGGGKVDGGRFMSL